jgi:amino acid transporter/mannitol/fructose-specific phosphotransferase system IIA component (Ntr-type)
MALRREVGAVTVFAVASGAMISSGLFVLPTVLFAEVGPGVTLCYLLAAVLLLPALLTRAELMTAMPKAGGDYFYIDRSLGPGFGTIGGVAAWASIAFKSAFALLGLGVLAADVWGWEVGGWQAKGVALGFCLLFTVVNLLGVRHAGRLQVGLVAVLLLILVGYCAVGVGRVSFPPAERYAAGGWATVLAGAAMVFISFGGVTKVAMMGEEVRRPARDLVVGMFLAAGVVSVLYVAVVLVTVGLLPDDPAQWRAAPISQAGGLLWGEAGPVLLGAAALAAFLTTGNAGILSASRALMAMSQDELVPASLGRVSDRTGAPARAVWLTSGFMALVILLLDLALFVKAASAMMILLFMLAMLCVVLMRESHIPTYRPTWRAPGYPWLEVIGFVAYGFLLVELGSAALAVAGLILGGALAWYGFYAKVHVLRESALVRLASRVARSDFADHDLEAELARVARERDAVLEDRFDRLIQRCTVLDLEESVTRNELFGIIADQLSPSVPMSRDEVVSLLERREALSATVVRPGLAIPHLIVEGVEGFHALLIRSRSGVLFPPDETPVHAIFVLAAPPEERNFYLKALVAVAEITQDEDFDGRWLSAGSKEALREVVLAAERRREHALEREAGEG